MSSQAEQLTPSTQHTELPEQQRQEAERKKLDLQEVISSGLTRLCLRMGEHMNPSHLVKLNHAINFLEVGQWMKEHGYSSRNAPRFRDRYDLYSALAQKIEQEVVLYLEFGVWQGASLRSWSNLLRNPLSALHGFDSFEGLPEAWDRFPKGTFAVKGGLPQFDDPRVLLHQGWFHETLPDFVLPAHERLLLNLDADLYSSTRYVLETLREAICPGTIILFDEFHDRQHEVKAFSEFMETHRMKFRLLGTAVYCGVHSAFERIE
jgi:hypothetical protein